MGDIATLGDWIIRIDRSSGPPYPCTIWNNTTDAWDTIGAGGSRGGAGSPLVRLPSTTGVLATYLGTAAGQAVLTAAGDVISIGALRVAEVPDFVQTASGDVIGVPGR